VSQNIIDFGLSNPMFLNMRQSRGWIDVVAIRRRHSITRQLWCIPSPATTTC